MSMPFGIGKKLHRFLQECHWRTPREEVQLRQEKEKISSSVEVEENLYDSPNYSHEDSHATTSNVNTQMVVTDGSPARKVKLLSDVYENCVFVLIL